MDHHHLPINCGQCCVNVPDVLSPQHLMSKELTRKCPSTHTLLFIHCTCVEFFGCNICFGIWNIWYKILAHGTQIAGY